MFHASASFDANKQRDKTKNEICKEVGITLIEVPYWWDRKISSLAATVYNVRPDLFIVKPEGVPISTTISSDLAERKISSFCKVSLVLIVLYRICKVCINDSD